MPRYADHEERRDELADTVCELILEHGIDRVSVRNVAQKSGWSVGAIRYYFPRHEDLMIYALTRTIDEAHDRILSAERQHAEDPVERAIAMIRAAAPVTGTTRDTIRIWIAFLDRGLSNPQIARLMARVWDDGRFFSRRMVASLAHLPLPQAVDDKLDDPFLEESAAILHVMWDGMSMQGVMSPDVMTPDEIDSLARRIVGTIAERIQTHGSGMPMTV
jgi:AcrR family transcriptional regulator